MNIDVIVFAGYLVTVAVVGFMASRKEKSSDDYFLAGRNLTWWIIGGSLIAANISTHHFIGMGGQGFSKGLAIASYEWIAAIALILYAKFFLPYYIKSRITTMPEFLQTRFDEKVRLLFAFFSLIGYIFIELAVVLYTGSMAIEAIFGLPLVWGLAILCVVGGGYAIYGGFKAIAYTDIIQVTVLILGGITVTLLGLYKVGESMPEYGASVWGGFRAVLDGTPEKFHMVMPWDDPELSWVGVFFGGMWLANIFYWGCNQFITQRTLAAKSVWHGQMGAVFAGFLKLLVPFLVILPGIIAFKLYNAETGLLKDQFVLAANQADRAFPTLVKQLLPVGFTGLVMAGLMGCVMSHIASMLSASSSILTFDIYKNLVKKNAGSHDLVRFGRLTSFAILVVATVVGYYLRDIKAIFTYIQSGWSFIYPAISAVFIAGFFFRRTSSRGALLALIVGPLWAILFTVAESNHWVPWKPIPFLFRAGVDFLFCCVIMWVFRTRGEIPESAVIDRTLPLDIAAEIAKIPWYKSFGFWATILAASVVALYIRFF